MSNIEIKNQIISALSSGNIDATLPYIHEDFCALQAKPHPYAGEYRGASGFLNMLQSLAQNYSLTAIKDTYAFEAKDHSDHMIFEFEIRGIHVPTQREFGTRVMEHWTFRDGKVISIIPNWFEVPTA